MPTNSFNVSRLLEELGEKNIIEMPVSKTIQPVIALDTMRGQVPLHQSPIALFGGFVAATLGETSAFEITSLDPGGVNLIWFNNSEAVGGPVNVNVNTTGTPLAFLAVGPTVHPPTNFGVDAILSTVLSGTAAAITNVTARVLQINPGTYAPLHIPRGQRCIFRTAVFNQNLSWGICLQAINATEADPDA